MHAHAHIRIDQAHGHPSDSIESHWDARFTCVHASQWGDENAL